MTRPVVTQATTRYQIKGKTTFEIFKFEKWPHPVRVEIKMDFHVSPGFHHICSDSRCAPFDTRLLLFFSHVVFMLHVA